MIKLPESVMALYDAHAAMCRHLAHTGFTFTLDGKLLGDIGEALVADAYGLSPPRKRAPGIDAYAVDGRSVQIKATQDENAGPAFAPGKGVANHLIFLWIDFRKEKHAHVLYNGPEAPVRELIRSKEKWTTTKRLNLAEVRAEDAKLREDQRLPRLR
ncbi:DUF6998 domain-containing protein [Sinorhizobium meliloti]|uniref:DUF6998 domain-containing protein n=1 Tax=Rhizobium meliloti TaxID=382 RepID=UPI00299F26AC|nr:hypothetical protein [Sinorhizobium meliloti]MDW9692138.1 hypothetical protein [Sinorhizobium meliloti]MDW9715814.1 hypothetical protein [Sinorhizobium meliloti]MDW9752702.1 hypothetical protein [Sinorhizobium meliloti]